MSFNNLKYDTNTYKHVLAEAIGPLEYQLGTPLNCKECFTKDPSYRMQRMGNTVDDKRLMIDIDSELMNITRKLSNNPADKHLPKEDENGNLCIKQSKSHLPDCNMPKMEYTHLSNPACNLKGTGWNRWEWLCQDPQDHVFLPFNNAMTNGVDTKQLAKDNHRPCIPNLMNINDSLPTPNNEPIINKIQKVNGVVTDPVSVDWQDLNLIKQY
jgi:hypothetical protein